MVNFGPLTAEIGWRVWSTPANFNRFRVLASLFSGLDQQHSTKAPRTFGWAAMTLGIGPHSIVVLVEDKHIPNAAYRWQQLLRQQQHNLNSTIQVTVKPRLHDTTCCQTGCQTRLTTGLTTGCPKQTSNRLSNRVDNRLDVCLRDTAGC